MAKAGKPVCFHVLNVSVTPVHALEVKAGGESTRSANYSIVESGKLESGSLGALAPARRSPEPVDAV